MKSKLVSSLGGYLNVRYEKDKNILDYIESLQHISSQQIESAKNLIDINIKKDESEIITVLIPFGATDDETYETLDITSVNEGKNYIENSDAIKKYGRIYGIVKFDNVTVASNLLKKAQSYLLEKSSSKITISLSAIDLHMVDSSIEKFKLGDWIKVIIPTHGIDDFFLLSKIDYDLDNPQNSKITLGTVEVGLTDNTTTTIETISDDINKVLSNLTAINIKVTGKLDVNVFEALKADVDDLTADHVVINEKLISQEAEIEDLSVNKLDAKEAYLTYATIENLNATNAEIDYLESDYGTFKKATVEDLSAKEAKIKDLDVKKLDAETADIKYANIDFSNIGKAAMEYFYAQSGLIKDVVIGEATITGEIVGVTISGDIIKGNTIIAEKLVIKGSDGLYYKLNTDGITTENEQTDYNSLNGQVIKAKSITATKISVNDLVAFDATIGGFIITGSSIYSGVKESIHNTTKGIYLDSDGQMALGDINNYLKYYKDNQGNYILDISATSIKIGSQNIETELNKINNSINLSLQLNYVNTQTYEESLDKYYPDYITQPLKITAITKDILKQEVINATYVFKRKGQNDHDYVDLIAGETVVNNVLTISHNLHESVEYKAYASVTVDDYTFTDEECMTINFNTLSDTSIDGNIVQIEATADKFVEENGNYNPGNIVLTPKLFNCNFDLWSYSIDLGMNYENIIPIETVEDNDQQNTTNVVGIYFNNETNELQISNYAECFNLTNVVVFKLKADIEDATNTIVITKDSDIASQVNDLITEMNELKSEHTKVSQELDGLKGSITTSVESMETKYNGSITEINQQLSTIIQTSSSIEEQFKVLKETVEGNEGNLETLTTYIRKTAKGIEVGELEASVKTLMATSYFAILFNDEEVMKLEQNLLTIDRIKAHSSFELGHALFSVKDYGFDITWGGE